MGSSDNRSSNSSLRSYEFDEWYPLMAVAMLVCAVFGYVLYNAVMSTAAEVLQRLLMVSPLILVFVVHWLSSSNQFNFPMPGSEPDSIHRAGGSAWGIVVVLLLLFFLISRQPALSGSLF